MRTKQINLSELGQELQKYTLYRYSTDEQTGNWYEFLTDTYSTFEKFIVNECFPESLTLISNSTQMKINHINKVIKRTYPNKCTFEIFCVSPLCDSTETIVISAV